MSVPLTGKVTSLTVKNTLHSNEIWTENLHIRNDKQDRKYINIREIIKKIDDLKILEKQLQETIQTVSEAIKNVPQGHQETIKGDKGEKGDKGDPGPQGPPGKQGKQGLRGQRGDNITQLSSISDVDISNIVDGAVLVWSASKNKWVAQNVFEGEEGDE